MVLNRAYKRRLQKGAILVMTAIVICGLIGMLALAVDVGFLYGFRGQYQNGIDAAALAAANGLRASIEDTNSMPQQKALVDQLAIRYALLNQVRGSGDLKTGSKDEDIHLVSELVDVYDGGMNAGIPRVVITTGDGDDGGLLAPLFFGGIFGLNAVRVNVTSTASLYPVDGGTGTIGGCWRPIFLPDTFFDENNRVHYAGDPARAPLSRLPDRRRGDFYRSRFAVDDRNIYPFRDGADTPNSPITGLRDTQSLSEVGVRTLMGQLDMVFTRQQYFIADFSGLGITSPDPELNSLEGLANYGYCRQLRVHDPRSMAIDNEIPVFSRTNVLAYNDVQRGLDTLKRNRVISPPDDDAKTRFRYVTNGDYIDPNSHGAIIPVLLFDPFLLNADPEPRRLKVTNFGLFFLDEVTADGTLRGFFVREIITGGTPISPSNFDRDEDRFLGFKRRWLPMSAQLLR